MGRNTKQTVSFLVGKWAPAIAYKIHEQNEILQSYFSRPVDFIRLKGVLVGSGFTDPINQIDYGDFYYNVGILDEQERAFFKAQERLAKTYIRSQQWRAAFEVWMVAKLLQNFNTPKM